jgi:hypothetical protein
MQVPKSIEVVENVSLQSIVLAMRLPPIVQSPPTLSTLVQFIAAEASRAVFRALFLFFL